MNFDDELRPEQNEEDKEFCQWVERFREATDPTMTHEQYWISGPRRDGRDRLYPSSVPPYR